MKTLHLSPRGPAKADGRSMTTGPESWHEANGHLILILSSTSPPPFPRRSSDAHHTSVQASSPTPYPLRTPFVNAQSTSYRSYQGGERERKTTTTKTEETVAQPGQQNRNWIDQGVFGMQKVTTTGPRTFLESPLLSAGLK